MDAKNSEMTKTADAIAALTEALAALGAAVEAKKEELAATAKQQAAEIAKKKQNLPCLKTVQPKSSDRLTASSAN